MHRDGVVGDDRTNALGANVASGSVAADARGGPCRAQSKPMVRPTPRQRRRSSGSPARRVARHP